MIRLHSRQRRAAFIFLAAQVAFGQVATSHALMIGSIFQRIAVCAGLDMDGSFAVVTDGDDTGRAQAELARLSALPGVRHAAWTAHLPFYMRAIPDLLTTGQAFWHVHASPGLPSAAGFELSAGRPLTSEDESASPRPVLISRALAAAAFGPKQAVGEVMRSHVTGGEVRVVGVLREAAVMPMLINAAANLMIEAAAPVAARRLEYMINVAPSARKGFAAAAEKTLSTPVTFARVESLRKLQARRQGATRGTYIVVAGVVLVVLGVVLLGTLGMSSFMVAERIREIGVRRALGATRRDIALLFLGESLALVTVGLAAGTILSLALNRFVVQRWLAFGGLDFSHLFLGIILFWATGLLAASMPALRASRVPPSVASRSV